MGGVRSGSPKEMATGGARTGVKKQAAICRAPPVAPPPHLTAGSSRKPLPTIAMRPPARPHEAGPANLVTNPEPGSAQTKTAQPVGVVGLAARNLAAPEGI
ncbi:hypothetical protein G6F57_016945 [Rhizopus arrhizus]|nr:hypothetical protein G6F57_016945 [Rhizopus arrhizus]